MNNFQVEQMVAATTYISNLPQFISVSEGERVYVVERYDEDWWFVKKHMTDEEGYLPSNILTDSETYTLILREKIDVQIQNIQLTNCNWKIYWLKIY